MASRAELWRALGALAEAAAPERHAAAAALGLSGPPDAAEHTEVLLLEVHPYASVYLGAEGMLGGEAADRVAGFWRAIGADPPSEPDHVASVCGLYAALDDAYHDSLPRGAERAESLRRVQRVLFDEHMVTWMPVFATKVREVAQGALGEWADLLLEALAAEADEWAGAGGQAPGIHHRLAPPPLAAEAEAESFSSKEFAGGLLAPVKTGIVLARSDLALASRKLGLGLRMGERRFTLVAMLDQDPVATLGWLEEVAASWRQRHSAMVEQFGTAAEFWLARASATESLLNRARTHAEAAASPGTNPAG